MISLKKYIREYRTGAVLGFRFVHPALSHFVISWTTISSSSSQTWGAFVLIMVWTLLVVQIATWGNKEFLLREFACAKSLIAPSWWTSLFQRLFVCCISGIVLFWFAPASEYAKSAMLWAFLLVIHQSFDALIIYEKRFTSATVIEVISTAIMTIGILTQDGFINVSFLLWVAIGTTALRVVCYGLLYRKVITPFKWHSTPNLLVKSLPFFMVSLTGFISSRFDQFLVSMLLPLDDLAQYQVYMVCLLHLQMTSSALTIPHVRSLIQGKAYQAIKFGLRTLKLLVPVIVPSFVLIHGILLFVYDFSLEPWEIALGILYVMPTALYQPIVYYYFGRRKEWTVVAVTIVSSMSGLLAALFLIPNFGRVGAMVCATFSQFCILTLYVVPLFAMRPGLLLQIYKRFNIQTGKPLA